MYRCLSHMPIPVSRDVHTPDGQGQHGESDGGEALSEVPVPGVAPIHGTARLE